MKSIVKLSFIVLGIIIMIIIVMIFINVQISTSTQDMNKTKHTMYELGEYINDMDAPISILASIPRQKITDLDTLSQFKNTFLINTQELNYYLEISQAISNSLTFSNYYLLFFEMLPEEKAFFDSAMIRKSNMLYEVEDNLSVTIEEYGLTFVENIAIVQLLHEHILTEHKTNYKRYLEYTTQLRQLYVMIMNILFFILISIIVLLIGLIYYLLKNDFKSIVRTYKQINTREYDINKVMKKVPHFIEEKEIYHSTAELFKEQKISLKFRELISDAYVIDDIVDKLFLEANNLLGIERVGIAFIDPITQVLMAEYGVATYKKLYLDIGYQVDIHKSSLKNVILNKESVINNNLTETYKNNPNSKSLMLITKEGIQSNICIPLISNDKVFGLVFLSSTQINHFTENDSRLVKIIISEITGVLNRAYLMKVFLLKVTMSFARLVDKKDNETGDHILRMVEYSKTIARGVNKLNLPSHPLSKKTIVAIERNASAHDIGKVAIADNILKKPGKLTSDEYDIMKTHAAVGGDIFKELNNDLSSFNSQFYKVAEDIARYHHEKWDGTGYPEGLKGTSIPLVARIVALADVFDALTSKRVYKDAFSLEQSLKIIDESCGKHFDPVIVEAFKNEFSTIEYIYKKHHSPVNN